MSDERFEADLRRAPTRSQVARRVAGLYRKADLAYARLSCPASADCCQLARRNRQPWLWPVEWDAVLGALQRQGRGVPTPRSDGGCPLLDEAGRKCTVYEDRPFGCRTYFCDRATGGRHPLEATVALSKELEAISMQASPEMTGPRPILEWLGAPR